MRTRRTVVLLVACWMVLTTPCWAASPTAEQALKLVPVQKDVEVSTPPASEAAKCTITPRKVDGRVGWVIENPDGIVLRVFLDTDGDNVVDQWRYYLNGLEVYRDIDSNGNGRADQYRWFHTAGSRWGIDRDEDGTVDAWKAISAEEVTAEVVAALAHRDADRFARVVLSDAELKSLGLGPAKTELLAKKISGIAGRFEKLAAQQKAVGEATKWIQFSGNRPGIVPAGTDGCKQDIRVYENVVAITETDGANGEVQIGTLIELGEVWRVVELPVPVTNVQDQLAAEGIFFGSPVPRQAEPQQTAEDSATQELLGKLQQLDAAAAEAATADEMAKYNARRADLLEELATAAAAEQEREMWIRQLADTVSAAAQAGGYPAGIKRLDALYHKLEKSQPGSDLAAYVKYVEITAEYTLKLQGSKTSDFSKVQAEWLKNLEKYAEAYPKSPNTAEAMLQVAMSKEFAGEEEEAKDWYARIAKSFPDSAAAKKSVGAQTRLDSVGKVIRFRGGSPEGKTVDLARYRGKVVLIQYWASWCEPCKADMAALKELATRYSKSGFDIIGVNLDNSLEQMKTYLAQNRLPWPQIHEEGGLDSRPATEMGILTLPTMILVDRDGKVVDRNIHVADLDKELQRLIR